MSRKMLINGAREEELRVAIVDHGTLEEYEIEVARGGLCRGNIYRGVVANVERSLNAAFIEFGAARHGFLSVNDLVDQSFHRQPGKGRPRIDEVLQRGKPILVQVTKDAEGTKGAQLTTNISLAGRYLVLRPYDSKSGVSRKVSDDDRAELQKKAKGLELPEGFGYIVRTNAIDQTKTTLKRDATALIRLWRRILEEYEKEAAPRALYRDQDLIVQAMRDFFDATISEVLIDDDDAFAKATAYLRACMPRSVQKITKYDERMPLFSRYGLERQIHAIHQRKVSLPSGGAIVIDPTEALTAIDVNSGKSTKRESQEETAYHTNMEAAQMVARQLRLRDIGGLVVVDFIDMRSRKYQRAVERELKEGMKTDKARVKLGRISPNGLLEINRQRIKQSIQLRTQRVCPTCTGSGHVPSIEMIGRNVLRRIESRALASPLLGVRVTLHPEVAQKVQNARRHDLVALETEFDIRIEVISSPGTTRWEEEIDWLVPTGNAVALRPAREEGQPRGGRKRRRKRNDDGALSAVDMAKGVEELPQEEEEEEESEASANGEEGRTEEGGRRRRRRRRRGRRRRSSGEAAVDGAGEEATSEEDGGTPSEESAAEASAEPASDGEQRDEDGEPRRRRRRSRRGGRRRRRSSGESALAEGAEGAEGESRDGRERRDDRRRDDRQRDDRQRDDRSRDAVNEAAVPETASEPKAAAQKAVEPKAAEPKAAEPKAAEPKAAEPKAVDETAADEAKATTKAKAATTKAKAAPSKSKVSAKSESADAETSPAPSETVEEAKPKRARRTGKKPETATDEVAAAASADEEKPKRKRTTRKTKAAADADAATEEKPKRKRTTKKAAATDETDAVEAKPKRKRTTKKAAATDAEAAADEAPAKPKRKRTTKKAAATEAEATADEASAKPKRKRTTKKAATDDATAEAKPKRVRKTTKKAAADAEDGGETKPKRTRKTTKKADAETETAKKTTRRKTATKAKSKADGDAADAEEKPKKTRKTTTRKKAAPKAKKAEDAAAVDSAEAADEAPKRKTRARKSKPAELDGDSE